MSTRASHSRTLSVLGPGLLVAASGIGGSDVIASTVAGGTFGIRLLWAIVAGAIFKFLLTGEVARWQLGSGLTVVEGWKLALPRWIFRLFKGYLVVWSVLVGGALVSSCGVAIENLTRGGIGSSAGAIAHAIAVLLLVLAPQSGAFNTCMKALIGAMFFSVVICAALVMPSPFEILHGAFVPQVPAGGTMSIFSLIGGVGGSVTVLGYNYLLTKKDRDSASLSAVRLDIAIGYVFTAAFAGSVLIIADKAFLKSDFAFEGNQAVRRMAEQIGADVGPVGFFLYSIGFWAAALASLIGVWRLIPSIIADAFRTAGPDGAPEALTPASKAFRAILCSLAATSLPFALCSRPIAVIVAFTILGSFFIPFLAATLLVLNRRLPPDGSVPRHGLTTSILLAVIVAVFILIGALETIGLFG